MGGGGVGQMEDYYGNTHYDTTFIHNDRVAPSKGFSTDTLFDRAMDYVETHRDEPFFCFVSTPVTHSPHYSPKELVAELKAAGATGDVGLFAQVQNLDAIPMDWSGTQASLFSILMGKRSAASPTHFVIVKRLYG